MSRALCRGAAGYALLKHKCRGLARRARVNASNTKYYRLQFMGSGSQSAPIYRDGSPLRPDIAIVWCKP